MEETFSPPPLRLPRPWNEDVIYMILIDRFHRGRGGPAPEPPFHGGDIAGILEKLDYLSDLGVSALWLSPVFRNQPDGYHGYWPVDFHSCDPRFGTEGELRELVSECHRRGMKVLLDMIVNHAGYEHPFARDPAHYHWFHHKGDIHWVSQESLEQGSLHGLPDFAQENEEVARYLVDMALAWIEKTGADGFRLDAVKHVPAAFWKRFSREIHSRFPGFLLLGEVLRGVPDYIARYQREDGIDSLLDVPFADTVRSTLSRDCEEPGTSLLQRFVELRLEYRTMLFNEIVRKAFARRPTDMRWFGALSACEEAYSKPMLMAPFIDNHDMSRFATESFPCGPRLRMALTLLLTWRGIPILTYGTECGMRGKTDGENRAPMPFGADPELTAFTRRLLRMRRSVGALTSGGVREILADREVYAFLRESPGGFALVALNNSRLRQVRELRIPELGARRRWRDPSSGMGVRLERRCLRMSLKGRSARVLLSD